MRIAVVGSAISSAALAPYRDPSWTIWACSPRGMQYVQRSDAWFEMHAVHHYSHQMDYVAFLAGYPNPVYMIEAVRSVPKSVAYPKDAAVAEFGPYFFESTIAWMLAMAIMQKPEEIGLWGVDMQAGEEFEHQRPSCHFFIREARQRGIKVTIPPQSDVDRPPPLYGYKTVDPQWIKLKTFENKILADIKAADEDREKATHRTVARRATLEAIRYMQRTWVKG